MQLVLKYVWNTNLSNKNFKNESNMIPDFLPKERK